jgi:hypothetical protein
MHAKRPGRQAGRQAGPLTDGGGRVLRTRDTLLSLAQQYCTAHGAVCDPHLYHSAGHMGQASARGYPQSRSLPNIPNVGHVLSLSHVTGTSKAGRENVCC